MGVATLPYTEARTSMWSPFPLWKRWPHYTGHSIFIYDRLGVGKSSKPHGIKEVQTATQIEILAKLVQYLRGNPQKQTFKHVIAVGHSYGSLQVAGIASKYGNLVDGAILTGFSIFSGGLSQFIASSGWTLACIQNPKRFKSLPTSGYVASGGITNDQQNFFAFPHYDPAVLAAGEASKWTATVGELLTQVASPALNYTNPLLIVTGDKDYIFCGGNCYQNGVINGTNLIVSSQAIFPATSNFSSYIPADTGHGINLHFSAPTTFVKIQDWVAVHTTSA